MFFFRDSKERKRLGNVLLLLFSPLHTDTHIRWEKNPQSVVVIFKTEVLDVAQNLKAFKLEGTLEIT